jgi:5-methylcytosine-specific restriction endonuclease McrA
MPFFLTGDEYADDPRWETLAVQKHGRDGKPLPKGPRLTIDALMSTHTRLKSKASHLKTDGYLTEGTALKYATSPRVLQALTVPVLDRPPLLHLKGDSCECLGDGWIEGFTYRLHKFLKRNPSRKEYDRNRAQKRDLEDTRLRALVYQRDGGCCRYCRSGVLNKKSGRFKDRRKVLQFDHVDPDQPAGPNGENFVVACGRCNEFKGRRLPHEADMVLLPVPTDKQRELWAHRGLLMVFDLELDHSTIKPASTSGSTAGVDPGVDPPVDPAVDPQTTASDEPGNNTRAQPHPDQAQHQQEQPAPRRGKGPGRVGEPPTGGRAGPPRQPEWTGQPARTSGEPDIYHGRSRAAPPTAPTFTTPPDNLTGRDSP